jgi:hypothetical protein
MTSKANNAPKVSNTDEVLRETVRIYRENNNDKTATAAVLGIRRQTLQGRLKLAVTRIGFVDESKPLVDGRVDEMEVEVLPLPEGDGIARYIATSLQNNTHLHPAWSNLLAYAEWLDDIPGSSCEFFVGTFSYDLAAYGARAIKRGSVEHEKDESLWYAPEVEPYFKDGAVQLAPALVWCGHMNILPTAAHPLNGLETYNGRKSNIVPHVKQALESVPSMPGEGTKLNLSTGTIGQRNYIQKNAGIKAEGLHTYGAVLVEVNSRGEWWVRHLRIDSKGRVYDIGPSERSTTGQAPAVRVIDGVVHEDAWTDAIVWGDIHDAEMEEGVRELGWGPGGMLDVLRPKRQVMHDIFSMRSRGHHEMKDFHALYRKHVQKTETVEDEVGSCAGFLHYSSRPWCETVIVPSNHDRHLTRWLNEEDPRKDLVNARYHTELQGAVLAAMERQDHSFNVLAYALHKAGVPEGIRFLEQDESFVLCKGSEVEPHGIEHGLHGDQGPNGARGSTRNLAKLGRAVTKGHDHKATIWDNVYSVGACSLEFAYMAGPTAHSVTHCVTFGNGARQLVTMWKGKWRA